MIEWLADAVHSWSPSKVSEDPERGGEEDNATPIARPQDLGPDFKFNSDEVLLTRHDADVNVPCLST